MAWFKAMSNDTPRSRKGFATADSIDERTQRALEEYLTVLPDGPRIAGATDMFEVVSESGKSYVVDRREGRCECPDARHRNIRCKHLRRVAFATGQRPTPPAVDPSAIDPNLGQHVEGGPRLAATDGGALAGETDDIETDDDRPDDCTCSGSTLERDHGLPCWPCFRDGFEEPNPAATEGE